MTIEFLGLVKVSWVYNAQHTSLLFSPSPIINIDQLVIQNGPHTPVSACKTNCVCHEELGMLKKEIRKQEILNEKKKIDYSPRSRYSVEQWVAGEKKSFERYA